MSFRRFPLLLLALCLAPAARAADFHFYVGNSGRTCDFGAIQAAVDAASAAPDDVTFIHIARDQTYTAQQIDIDGKNVHLLGGYATCAQGTPDTIKTILDGSGGARRSLINLRGSTRSVAFSRLTLRGGDERLDNESYGGALDITEGPHTRIFVDNTQFTGNAAGWGGAISLRWSDPQNQQRSFLSLGQNVTVSSNRGSFGGGGIYCRNGWVEMTGNGHSVFQNTAGGSVESGSTAPSAGAYGGGLLLHRCVLRLSSAGFTPTIWNNTATGPGGGIAALFDRTVVEIGNTSPTIPTRIADNHSDRYGGAFTIERGAQVTAYDTLIERNSATQGGGAVALFNNDSSYRSSFTATSAFTPTSLRHACRSDVECNAIRDNEAYDGNTAEDGAAFRVSTEAGSAAVVLEGTRVSANRGKNLFRYIDDGSGTTSIKINGGLIDRNDIAHNLFDLGEGYSYVSIAATTIADNAIQGGANFRLNGFFTAQPFGLTRSIVYQPGIPLISISTGTLNPGKVSYVLAHDLTGVPAETGPGGQALNLVGPPGFIDPANGNYFLQTASPAVDFAPVATPIDLTRDRGRRDIGVDSAPDRFGVQDLGAFERPNGAPVFLQAALPEGQVGRPYAYQVSIVSSRGETLRFAADGLPAGLAIHPEQGEITGTPSVAGLFNVTLNASNGVGSASLPRTLSILAADAANGECGPVHALELFSAPYEDLCDVGTPSVVQGDGAWTWECAGVNGGATASCVAYVDNRVLIDLSHMPDGTEGEEYRFQVPVESWNQPVVFLGSGLPPGLVIGTSTGDVVGTPTQAGEFEVRITADNGQSVSTATRFVIIEPSGEAALFADGFEIDPREQ